MHTQLIVHNASQLLTVAAPTGGGPRRGVAMQNVGLIENGAVAIINDAIVAVGPSAQILADFTADNLLDAGGRVIMPGFVDAHTHACWAGDVSHAPVEPVFSALVQATREATLEMLVAQTQTRLDRMLASGTTTAEIKTGFGLNLDDEIKLLDALRVLDEEHAMDVVSTFLGARAVPPEFAGQTDAYVNFLVQEIIPTVADLQYQIALQLANGATRTTYVPAAHFCEVLCSPDAFTVEQTARLFEAAEEAGLALKLHASGETADDAASLAMRLGAASISFSDAVPGQLEALAQSSVITIALPSVALALPARALIEAGGALALATDFGPHNAPYASMQSALALACQQWNLTPEEAVCAATLNAAHAIGVGDVVGSLEPGKQADLLILNASDFREVARLAEGNLVRSVLKKGQLVQTDGD